MYYFGLAACLSDSMQYGYEMGTHHLQSSTLSDAPLGAQAGTRRREFVLGIGIVGGLLIVSKTKA